MMLSIVNLNQTTICLTGTLTHLPTLATKASHALLAPLGTHASRNLQHKVKFLILLDAISEESSLNKLSVSGHKTNEMTGDVLLILNHGLEIGDGGATLDGVGHRGARGRVYDNLHNYLAVASWLLETWGEEENREQDRCVR